MPKLTKHRLEKLKQRKEKLNAKIQTIEARLKTSERKIDVRKKILVGTYYLEHAEKNNSIEDLKLAMDKFLKRDFDRELFELPPLSETMQ
jgi:hypothetical protein